MLKIQKNVILSPQAWSLLEQDTFCRSDADLALVGAYEDKDWCLQGTVPGWLQSSMACMSL